MLVTHSGTTDKETNESLTADGAGCTQPGATGFQKVSMEVIKS